MPIWQNLMPTYDNQEKLCPRERLLCRLSRLNFRMNEKTLLHDFKFYELTL